MARDGSQYWSETEQGGWKSLKNLTEKRVFVLSQKKDSLTLKVTYIKLLKLIYKTSFPFLGLAKYFLGNIFHFLVDWKQSASCKTSRICHSRCCSMRGNKFNNHFQDEEEL